MPRAGLITPSAPMTLPLALVVILSLAFSLVDAFFILPAHLSHLKPLSDRDSMSMLGRLRRSIADGLSNFSRERYLPFIVKAVRARYLTLAIFVGVWLVIMSFIQGGWVKQTFYPMIPGDDIILSVTLSDGVSFTTTRQVVAQVNRAAETVRAHYRQERGKDIVQNVRTFARENNIRVTMELMPSEERDLPIDSVSDRWREEIGFVADTKTYTFDFHLVDREPPIKLGLTADDPDVLNAATAKVEQKLATYDGLFGINNSKQSQVEAFMIAFDTDLAPIVGQQVTLTSTNSGTVGARISLMIFVSMFHRIAQLSFFCNRTG